MILILITVQRRGCGGGERRGAFWGDGYGDLRPVLLLHKVLARHFCLLLLCLTPVIKNHPHFHKVISSILFFPSFLGSTSLSSPEDWHKDWPTESLSKILWAPIVAMMRYYTYRFATHFWNFHSAQRHRATTVAPNHHNMTDATKGSSKQLKWRIWFTQRTNKCNNQANNAGSWSFQKKWQYIG